MKIDKILMHNISENTSENLVKNFKKVIKEMNLDDDTDIVLINCNEKSIELCFDSFWKLHILPDKKYTISYNNKGTKGVYGCDYDRLLKFMENNGIRKTKKSVCAKDNLYIIDF